MSEKALRVVATGDMFITRRIAEDGYHRWRHPVIVAAIADKR